MKGNEHVYCLRTERPKVLFLGNGLTRNSGGLSWNGAILGIAAQKNQIKGFMKTADKIKDGFTIPYTPLALITAPVEDKERHAKYMEVFRKEKYEPLPLLERLVKLPFSAVLTTNYTYEVENALLSGFSYLSQSAQMRKSQSFHRGAGRDTYLLERCNVVHPFAPQIWHVHGEINRRSSVVLTHDEYARLITAMLGYLREQGNRYYDTIDEFEFRSWIDYLLMADVYVLGLELDFSEFDLWWMLGRRKREKAPTGKLVFYEYGAECKKPKQDALFALGADVRHLGFNSEDKKSYSSDDRFYYEFYEAAICDIERELLKQEATHV